MRQQYTSGRHHDATVVEDDRNVFMSRYCFDCRPSPGKRPASSKRQRDATGFQAIHQVRSLTPLSFGRQVIGICKQRAVQVEHDEFDLSKGLEVLNIRQGVW
ncbi:hypothetical protein BGV70_13560 [Burkholderia ubonensis]|nr:hypothetical protein WJ29_00840 [Burkholderia ubonensis]OJA66976.1 hypothetical protein BGV70_13560 [Burkholderia ubonensis]